MNMKIGSQFKIYARSLAVVLPMALGLSSCEQDEFYVPQSGDGDVTLTFAARSMGEVAVKSRAGDMKDDNEKRINRLYVFFFGADGEYLKGGYLTGYINAPEDGGYYSPGQGENMIKIDNTKFADPTLAKAATIYAVANVNASLLFGGDADGDGRPDKIKRLSDLEELVYAPSNVTLGLPSGGMPMVSSKVMDLTVTGTGSEASDDRRVELEALMARVDLDIKLSSDVQEGNLPSLTLVEWRVRNLPTRTAFTATAKGRQTGDDWTGAWTKMISTRSQRTIYNNNGEISLTFYMYENVQDEDWTVDEGEQWADPSQAPNHGGLYPDGINESHKQRYKPYIANKNATAVGLHGYYTDYNGMTHSVYYTLYLGANHTDDFKVKRNHQYKNDITIKGLTAQQNESGEYTLDARVNVEQSENEYYVSILRERNHDAHFCVTPMDVYLFAYRQDPSIEVILGECPEGSETPDAATVPDWVRMERIDSLDMERGTVSVSGFTPFDAGSDKGTHIATGKAWQAGNGSRAYFTSQLVTETLAESGRHVTISNSRDRVYFYIDENLTQGNRSATVTLIYKEKGMERKRSAVTLEQVHMLPVRMRDGGTIYMEQYEEYLDHYDPLDEYSTEQLYEGLPWAMKNTPLGSAELPQLYDGPAIWSGSYDSPGQVFNDGYEYTPFVIYRMEQGRMALDDVPQSAFQYCHNKNKRNAEGDVPASYAQNWLGRYYQESNHSKWFLPGIRQMEDALTQYYVTYKEFQEDFYWSASAGERENSDSGQSPTRARATKVNPDGSYVESGGRGHYYENGQGGYALREVSLRIRACRVDLNPVDY